MVLLEELSQTRFICLCPHDHPGYKTLQGVSVVNVLTEVLWNDEADEPRMCHVNSLCCESFLPQDTVNNVQVVVVVDDWGKAVDG